MKTAFEISIWADGHLMGICFRLVLGLFFFPVLLAFGWKKRKQEKTPSTFVGLVLPAFMLPVWVALHLIMGFHYLATAREFIAAYKAGNYKITEGPVSVLRQQKYEGHSPGDLVEVAGRRFEIGHFVVSPFYRATIAHGGVIREENWVRIYSVSGKIVRVDYREKEVPNQSAEPRAASGQGSNASVISDGILQ